ncbi:uncharacterized protein [Miscanthus floridulus]
MSLWVPVRGRMGQGDPSLPLSLMKYFHLNCYTIILLVNNIHSLYQHLFKLWSIGMQHMRVCLDQISHFLQTSLRLIAPGCMQIRHMHIYVGFEVPCLLRFVLEQI